MTTIGIGRLDLVDISDAIISGTRPSSTEQGQLWIDTSKSPPVLMVYDDGNWIVQHLDVFQMDENLSTEIISIIDTLGSITNDDLLNYNDRVIIANEINRVIGRITSTKDIDNFASGLPTMAEIDSTGLGMLAVSRKSAKRLGIDVHDSIYLDTELEYNTLRGFLNGLITNGVNAWDITTDNHKVILDIDGDIFRQRWLSFYNALLLLEGEILAVPGPAGQSALNMILTNESISIATDNNGKNGDYSLAFTDILIYEGANDNTESWVIEYTASSEVVGKLVGNRYTLTDVTGFTENAYVEFTATREGFNNIVKRLSISKAKTGAAAINEWINTSSPVLSKDANGLFTPETVSFSAKRRIGGGDILPLKGIFKIYQSSGGNEILAYETDSSDIEDTITWRPTHPDIRYMKVEFYKDLTELVDTQTIVIVSDGMNADQPVTITLDNDTIVIPTKANGDSLDFSYDYAEVTVTAYLGNSYTNLTLDTSPYSLHFIPQDGIEGVSFVKTESARRSYKVTNMSVDQASILIVLTDKESGRELANKTVFVSKNKHGESGEDGVYKWIQVPKVISVRLDEYNKASYHPSVFTVNAYSIVGENIRELDSSVDKITIEAESVNDGQITSLSIIDNGSEINTLQLLNSLGNDIDYRNYNIRVSVSRGTTTEVEYIEIVSDGRSASQDYMWIRYSVNEDGTDFTVEPHDAKYIGVAVTKEPTAPSSETAYIWMLARMDGLPGENGSMLHIKYSNDGGLTFTANDGEDAGDWIGMYIDTMADDSANPADYTWNRQAGRDSITGFLTNESVSFSADHEGDVTSYLSNSGYFEVYDGVTVKTGTDITYSVVKDTAKNIVVTIDVNGHYTISSMTGGRDVTSGSATLRSKYSGVTIDKVLSVTKSMAGIPAENAVVGSMTNDSMVFPADSQGIIGEYTNNSGTFHVYDGLLQVNEVADFSIVNKTNIEVSITSLGVFTVTSMVNGRNIRFGSAVIHATYNGKIVEKTISVTKSVAGENSTSYWLTSDSNAIVRHIDGNITPESITFTSMFQTGEGSTSEYSGRFKIETSKDGKVYTVASGYPTTTNSASTTFVIPVDTNFIKATSYKSNGTNELLDYRTVPILSEVKGDNAINGVLDNELSIISTDADGKDGDYSGVSSKFTVYSGFTDVTGLWDITIVADAGVIGSITGTTYTVLDMTVDTGRVTFTAKKTGEPDVVKVFSIAKTKQGFDATNYYLSSDNASIQCDGVTGEMIPDNITVTGFASKGAGEPIEFKGYFIIYEQARQSQTIDAYNDLVVNSRVQENYEYIISAINYPHVERYRSTSPESVVNYVLNKNTLNVHIEWYKDAEFTKLLDLEKIPVITDGIDGKDSYRVEIRSTNGNMFKNGVIDTWLYAEVYKGDMNITSEIESSLFRWTRTSSDPASDIVWNERYFGGAKEINITVEDVYKKATFTCEIVNKIYQGEEV